MEKHPHRSFLENLPNSGGCSFQMARSDCNIINYKATIQELFAMFARFGLSDQVMTDKVPQLTIKEEFSSFMDTYGIEHNLRAPCHPSSNDLARRFLQTFKCSINAREKNGDLNIHLL